MTFLLFVAGRVLLPLFVLEEPWLLTAPPLLFVVPLFVVVPTLFVVAPFAPLFGEFVTIRPVLAS